MERRANMRVRIITHLERRELALTKLTPPPPVGALICKFRPFSLAQKATSSSRPPSFSMPALMTPPRRWRFRSARFRRSAPRFPGLSAAEDGTASTDSTARDRTIDEWWRIFNLLNVNPRE